MKQLEDNFTNQNSLKKGKFEVMVTSYEHNKNKAWNYPKELTII